MDDELPSKADVRALHKQIIVDVVREELGKGSQLGDVSAVLLLKEIRDLLRDRLH